MPMLQDSAHVAHAFSERTELVTSIFIIPVAATFLMGLAEGVASAGRIDWRERFVKTGWDLCVLALGSTGAVFSLPQVQSGLGNAMALYLGVLTIIVTIGLGLVIALIRRHANPAITGWKAILAIGLGGTALMIPWYFVLGSY